MLVKFYIENNKDLSDSEILGFIIKYVPYFIEEKYKKSKKRDSKILDFIDFNNINDQLIETFKTFKFEEVFKEKMANFNEQMVSKIIIIFISLVLLLI